MPHPGSQAEGLAARQQAEGWGTGVIPRLAAELKNELPDVEGSSERNIKRMVQFFREYLGLVEKVPQASALLTASGESVEIGPWAVAQLGRTPGRR